MEAVADRTHPTPGKPSAFDLTVIGGGPAGTSAAITAARAGAQVLLLERGRLPRQRVCGEFVSAESLALLAGLLDRTAPGLLQQALRIPEARLFFDGHSVPTQVEPAAASVARFDLDFALWRAAEEVGVRAQLETSVESISGRGPFTLRTRDGRFHSQAVINATGRWSNLRAASPRSDLDREDKWLGIKGHFSEISPHLSVDLYFFEGGYCGVQPVELAGTQASEGRINACAMVRSDVARSLPEVFAQHPQLKERAQTWRSLMEPVTTSPLIFGEPESVEHNVLLAGDAAGFVDPFVGDGISLALRSGVLAAECLGPFFKAQASLAEAVLRYRKAYQERLLPVFRNSSRIRRLLGLPRPIRRSVGHLLEAAPAVSRFLISLTR
ncbi:MAG: NAD(P)/FAD-dependent oxidoreductase [Terriglobales bacterium]